VGVDVPIAANSPPADDPPAAAVAATIPVSDGRWHHFGEKDARVRGVNVAADGQWHHFGETHAPVQRVAAPRLSLVSAAR
jgi:hypothetical protein